MRIVALIATAALECLALYDSASGERQMRRGKKRYVIAPIDRDIADKRRSDVIFLAGNYLHPSLYKNTSSITKSQHYVNMHDKG